MNLNPAVDSPRKNARHTKTMCCALVLAILGASSQTSCRRAPRTVCPRTPLIAVASAIDRYQADCHQLPTALDQLSRRVGRRGWKGPYLPMMPTDDATNRLVRDIWGMPLQYRQEADRYVLRSTGPDRVYFTADDLTRTWPVGDMKSAQPAYPRR
jgi:hypothetical protein